MTKWLYFRAVANVSGGSGGTNDTGYLSNDAASNSELRSSAMFRYENLLAILPFSQVDNSGNRTGDEYPLGGSSGSYTGVMMLFRPSLSSYADQSGAPHTAEMLNRDIVYLETQGDAGSLCKHIINKIENSESPVVYICDNASGTGERKTSGVISCKFIEISRTFDA